MALTKAIVPMAGLGTRLYPVSVVLPKGLMPFVLADGRLVTGLQLIAESLLNAGIEQIGVVVSPETQPLYEQFLEGGGALYAAARERRPAMQQAFEAVRRVAERITLIPQAELHGLGHAIWCAREFAGGEPVLVALGDHISLQNGEALPAAQLIEAYTQLQCPLYAVHTVPLPKVSLYGILKGRPTEHPRLYALETVVEKPSPEVAQQSLHTPGLPADQFFAHYGLYAFPSLFWEVQAQLAEEYRQWGREWYLVDAQQRLTTQTPAYLLHVEGECLDFGTPEEYRHAFCVLAERGGKRNA